MATGRHHLQGDITGNPNQSKGKHVWGVRFIPLGDRNRDIREVGFSYQEERDRLDGSEKWLKKAS